MIKRSAKLPDDWQRHDHEHDIDDLADNPTGRAFGFARRKATGILVTRASMPAAGQAA